jgi:SAM-dependent methyltransferase
MVLDLPEAIEKAAPILAKHKMGDRVTHLNGNILIDELGEAIYNVVLMANVAHHFTVEQNLAVAKKVFRALRPGGIFTIIEVLRSDKIKYDGDMLSAMGDFFFALSSTSGTWSAKEIQFWQKQAGFVHFKKATFLTIPGLAAITAVKI